MNFATMARTLGFLTLTAAVAALILLGLLALRGSRRRVAAEAAEQPRALLGLAWLAAAIAAAGSLYLSEVVGFVPCLLCWYQRIAMYPLVVVLGVAALLGDVRVWRYGLPLALIGFAISAWHVTVQARPGLELAGCSPDVPCSLRYISVFGFISIPVMAGAAFLLIAALLLAVRSGERWREVLR